MPQRRSGFFTGPKTASSLYLSIYFRRLSKPLCAASTTLPKKGPPQKSCAWIRIRQTTRHNLPAVEKTRKSLQAFFATTGADAALQSPQQTSLADPGSFQLVALSYLTSISPPSFASPHERKTHRVRRYTYKPSDSRASLRLLCFFPAVVQKV